MGLTTLATFDPTNVLQPAQDPADARQDACVFGASLTIAKGQAIGKKTADSKMYLYVDANVDGTGVCVGFSKFAGVTDASGNFYIGGSTTPGPDNPPLTTGVYYYAGTFDTADLTGYDAAALADLKGVVKANGFIKFG